MSRGFVLQLPGAMFLFQSGQILKVHLPDSGSIRQVDLELDDGTGKNRTVKAQVSILPWAAWVGEPIIENFWRFVPDRCKKKASVLTCVYMA